MKKLLWLLWFVLTIGAVAYLGYVMFYSDNKQHFLIGEATHGHHQIELACTSCHTEPFGGKELIQNACLQCHEEELEASHDSHPKKKFNDPRNADLLEIIDARYCVSCHTEHKNEQTHPMGVTLPTDYCWHCHTDIGEERESHKDLAFDSCASSGCHNYHDNRALYETFLVANAGGEWKKHLSEIQAAMKTATATQFHELPHHRLAVPEKMSEHPDVAAQFAMDKHAQAGLTCASCHNAPESDEWIEKPGIAQCQSCHQPQAEHFMKGKHGMRLAQEMSAMSPSKGRLEFNEAASHATLGCNSCHKAHDFSVSENPVPAGTTACLSCHSDEHSLAFEQSPHAQANANALADNPVTCATCHMPKVMQQVAGHESVFTQHNQNDNLRPNEKMIRSVCMDCHNLEFSIDALADPALIQNNFNGKPAEHIPSIDWSLKREQ